MKCFYHNDPDGQCSAYWVKKYCEKEAILFTVKDFIEMNYDKKFPIDIVKHNEFVFIVDFSISPKEMWDLRCKTRAIIWIDHHKTAIDKFKDFQEPIDGIRWDDIAACTLTWSYFFHELADKPFGVWDKLHTPDEIMEGAPLFTKYIHLWDTWKWKNEDDFNQSRIEAFITALSAHDLHPVNSTFWDELDDNEVENVINEGHHMLHFRDGYATSMCNSIGKIINFEGYRCFVCNMPRSNSEWYKSIDSSTYDILMPFYYSMNTGKFIFSMYGNGSVDVSAIAVKYGGGGHFSSAGFQCENLPF